MIQLRIKTEYSFGQTFASIDRIIERLKEQGCTAAGIVDAGSTWGHVTWFAKCRAAGIQPLLGVELVVSDSDETPAMWFLAKNTAGLSELYALTSRAHRQTIQGRSGKVPRLYHDDVLAISNNILAFAGDVVDERLIDQLEPVIDLNPSSRVLRRKKRQLAEKLDLSVVQTSDNVFVREEDADIF